MSSPHPPGATVRKISYLASMTVCGTPLRWTNCWHIAWAQFQPTMSPSPHPMSHGHTAHLSMLELVPQMELGQHSCGYKFPSPHPLVGFLRRTRALPPSVTTITCVIVTLIILRFGAHFLVNVVQSFCRIDTRCSGLFHHMAPISHPFCPHALHNWL